MVVRRLQSLFGDVDYVAPEEPLRDAENPWHRPPTKVNGTARGKADPSAEVIDLPVDTPVAVCARVLHVLERGRRMLREMNGDGGDAQSLPADLGAPLPDCPGNLCWRCRTRRESRPSPAIIHQVLEGAIRGAVLPGLQAQHRGNGQPVSAVAGRLVDCLLAPSPDIDRTIDAIEAIARPYGWSVAGCARLFEESARDLGDRFAVDACDQTQLTTALLTLQVALDAMREPMPGLPDHAPSSLVVTPPYEPHRLGARLAAGTLEHAGWHTTTVEPVSEVALGELLDAGHYDVLHIALSCVFRRDHWQPELKRLIAHARAASRNLGITVSLGGRPFNQAPAAWKTVGADMFSASSATLPKELAGAAHRA